jgi:glycosyltransferase involved in cell wall biosynthesis
MSSVLFISLMKDGAWGGSEELWYKTAFDAVEKGWRVGAAVHHWTEKETKMDLLAQSGAAVYYIPNRGVSKRNLSERIQYKITKKILLRNYIPTIPVEDYDITVVSLGAFEITASAWKNFYQRVNKLVILFHNYNEKEIFKPSQEKALKAWLDKASLKLFASRRIKQVLETKLDITITNADVLLNPISFVPPSQTRVYPPLKNGNYVFVTLAALEVYRKAQDQLIVALSTEKWKNRNWQLELYGDGKDRLLLEELVSKHKMQDKIFFKGHTKNVQQVLFEAHLVLQLTHLDAMPIAVVEAMAMSRPLVVSDVGDMPDWVRGGINGFVAPNASPGEIDAVLDKAWTEKDNWSRMGERSFEIFQSKFPSSAEEILLGRLEEIVGAQS